MKSYLCIKESLSNFHIDEAIKQKILESQAKEYHDLKIINKMLNTKLRISYYRPIHTLDLTRLAKNEVALEELANQIRNTYMLNTYCKTHKNYKSPLIGTQIYTSNGSRIQCTYERLIKYRAFEDSIPVERLSNFTNFNIAYSSAMSAITSILHLVERSFCSVNAKGFVSASYFESLQFFKGAFTSINISYSSIDESEHYDFYFIETINADFELHKSKLDVLIKNIHSVNRKSIIYIILDTSLQGNCFSLTNLFDNVDLLRNIVICNLRSGIKLDEEGMEITNCGLATFYFSNDLIPLVEVTRNYLEKNRGIYGNALTLNDVFLLDNKAFFRNKNYSKAILDNTKRFVDNICIKSNMLFNNIIYPKSYDYNYLSPYLFLKFEMEGEGTHGDYELLLDIIYHHTLQLGMNHNIRNSFGFRNVSCEYFNIVNTTKFVFKIAPGKLTGIRYYHFLYLINSLSKIDLKCYRKLRPLYKQNYWNENLKIKD